MPWFVRGDLDGFFGLAIDNLVQLLLIDALCRGVLGFPSDLVYGRILPGAAVFILVGNVAYALQARELARRTGRSDVCAPPYGTNTVSLFAHLFLVMLPAELMAAAAGAADPRTPRIRRPALIDAFQKNDVWIAGAFAIEQGFLFSAMLLAAAVVGVIERRRTDAFLSVDPDGHDAQTRAGVAFRGGLPDDGCAVLQRPVDDQAR